MRERLAPVCVSISGITSVAVVGVARQRLGVGDELAAPGAMERGGERHLDAELVRAMGLAFADAFDLQRVQGKTFFPR
jgi:hypothetical protein